MNLFKSIQIIEINAQTTCQNRNRLKKCQKFILSLFILSLKIESLEIFLQSTDSVSKRLRTAVYQIYADV